VSAPRPLPRSLAVHPDESLAGYVLNIAARLRTNPGDAARRINLITDDGSRTPRIASAHAVRLPDALATALASTCRLSPKEVEGLTLARWSGPLLTPAVGYGAPTSEAGRAWVSPPRTRACPRCLPRKDSALADGGAGYATWRTRWTLPWSFACVRHERLLLDRCPACATQLGIEWAFDKYGRERNNNGLLPSMLVRDQHPAACRARVTAQNRVGSAACGQRLDAEDLPARTVGPDVLAAQARIDRLLDRDDEDRLSLGAHVNKAQYLHDLRLVAFALQITDPDLWPLRPPAGTEHALKAVAQYDAGRPVGARRRPGQRWKLWTEPPDDSTVTAGTITAAMRILDQASTSDARDLLQPLVSAAAAAEPSLWSRVRLCGSPSPRLARFTSPGYGGLTSNHVLARSVPLLPAGLHGGHVPQFAGEDTDALVAPLAPGTSARERRRATSLALHRLISGGDLHSAASALGIPQESARSAVARLGRGLRAAGTDDAYWELLPVLVDRIAAHRVHWEARRRLMADWHLPDEDWDHLCSGLVRAGARPSRPSPRLAVEALIWAQTTSGDVYLSPQTDGLGLPDRALLLDRVRYFTSRRPTQNDLIMKYADSLADQIEGRPR